MLCLNLYRMYKNLYPLDITIMDVMYMEIQPHSTNDRPGCLISWLGNQSESRIRVLFLCQMFFVYLWAYIKHEVGVAYVLKSGDGEILLFAIKQQSMICFYDILRHLIIIFYSQVVPLLSRHNP